MPFHKYDSPAEPVTNLIVVGVDPVAVDILQLGETAEIGERRDVVEQILIGHHLGRFLLADGKIAVGLEIAAAIFGAELDAFVDALGVIEGAEHQRLAEIAVVEKIRRDLVVGVDAEIEMVQSWPRSS